MIDFESMQVGDVAPMARGEWDGAPRAQFNAACEYHAQHPEVQFEVLSEYEMNKDRGIEELVFNLKRIR
jgi:hypothetical protein